MRTSFHHQPEAQHPHSPAINTPAGRLPHLLAADNPTAPALVRYWRWSQPVDATPGGQLAINNDDGLPNARPIAFGDSPRNQLSHNTIFSAAPIPIRSH